MGTFVYDEACVDFSPQAEKCVLSLQDMRILGTGKVPTNFSKLDRPLKVLRL